MSRIKVVIAEDSLTVRKRLVEIVEADPELELVGEAADGKEAIELCRRLRPDVLSMDMMMPLMTGLAATEYFCDAPGAPVSEAWGMLVKRPRGWVMTRMRETSFRVAR